MNRRLIFTILLIAIVLTAITGCSSSEEIGVISTTGSNFEVGQVWRYQTRPGEEKSTIIIVKVESDKTIGNIIHISINGLKISNPQVEGGFNEHVPHMPFSEDAIENSVIELIDEGVLVRKPFEDPRRGRITIALLDETTAQKQGYIC